MKDSICIIAILTMLAVVFFSCCVDETPEEVFCFKPETGEGLSLTEARQIAIESECGDRLKDSYMCNNYTGTWWIDLDIQKEGCNPACVVDVETGEAVINWRCTGVLPDNSEKPVGGERDEHGCLGAAGYTWHDGVDACVREWELNENQILAAGKAVEYVGYVEGLTVLGVDVARCPGCFIVHLERGRDRIDVTLENWEVKEKTLTPEECEREGGRVLNIVGGFSCEEDEINMGGVTGFISPHVCCVSSPESGNLTLEDAIEVAMNSVCTEEGNLTENYMYNPETLTWWIDLDIQKEGCNPACVVDVETGEAVINWRCTGLIT